MYVCVYENGDTARTIWNNAIKLQTVMNIDIASIVKYSVQIGWNKVYCK